MLKKSELEKIRKFAAELAIDVGEFQMKHYRKTLTVREKARSSLVTMVDVKSEKMIQSRLGKKFPSFRFLGEESGEQGDGKSSTPIWHVDPLDGTTNYVHGFPMFCVSIGLALQGKPILGVIHIPTLGETFHGALGCGAKLNRNAIHVSKRKNLSECLLTTGFAYNHESSRLSPEIKKFERAHMEARAVRRPGAAALDLAYVAAGVFDGFWEKNLSSWDICAGSLLVSEAGGEVSDYSGNPMDLHGKEILATNSLVHRKMQDVLLK